jgi:hypothetical protein
MVSFEGGEKMILPFILKVRLEKESIRVMLGEVRLG